MKAVLLISHGSRSTKTVEEVKALVSILKSRSGLAIFEFAFLELQKPSIEEGIDVCVEKGAKEICVLLNFLNAGTHVNVDIPEIVDRAQKKHPNIKISLTEPVGQHSKIADLFLSMIDHS